MNPEFTPIVSWEIIVAVIAFLFAALLSFTATPLVRVLAFKINAVDVPKDNRRMHKVPMPRLGGLAIFISFIATMFIFNKPDNIMIATAIGSTLIVAIGVVDDIFRIKAFYKFIVQVAASLVVISQGIIIERINIFDTYIHFGIFSVPITILWICGLTNAINLIDGLDGLACGISTISAISLFVVTLLLGDPYIAFLIAILCGSCIGFLPFNMNPAKIFVGDTGAMFLGFILSVISIQGLFKVHAVLTFAVPFMVLGVPIFDTMFAMLRRILHGRNPFSPDRGHLHHRFIDGGFNQKQTVRLLYAITAMFGVASIMLTQSMFAASISIIVLAFVIGILTFIIVRNKKTRELSGIVDVPHIEAQIAEAVKLQDELFEAQKAAEAVDLEVQALDVKSSDVVE